MSTVVVFDLDDTLYPERSFVESAFRHVGQHVADGWGLFGFGACCIELFQQGVRHNTFQQAHQQLRGGTLTDDQVEQLLGLYRSHRPLSLPWHQDAFEAIRAMHGRRPLALLSDGYLPAQLNKAAALGLDRWIPDPVFTEQLGRRYWKPALDGFRLIDSRHPGFRFVYVGDNPAKDFIAPRSLGWWTVHIRRKDGIYSGVEPSALAGADIVVDSLDELPVIVHQLET